MTDPNTQWVRHKSRHTVAWALSNLKRIGDHPCATMLGKPLEGRTVVVCGAGYSLSNDLEHLRHCGAPIVAVNKAAVVLRKHGIEPWAVVARESIDVSEQIEGDALVCADISAHPNVWRKAERLAWFIPGYPRQLHLAAILGVPPTFGGTSAFTTAVHLCRVWGAARVVLVGADLCWRPDGSGRYVGYCAEAPRGSMTATIEGDALVFSGGEDDDALCEASGQVAQPKRTGFDWYASHDWGELYPVIDTLADEHDWLVTEAQRHGERVEYVNASSRGIGIAGWRHQLLKYVRWNVSTPVLDLSHRVGPRRMRALHAELSRQQHTLEVVSQELSSKDGPNLRRLATLDLWGGAPLVEVLGAGRLLDGPKDPHERCLHTYETYTKAADEAREIMEAGQ